jgi:hypothetical protein
LNKIVSYNESIKFKDRLLKGKLKWRVPEREGNLATNYFKNLNENIIRNPKKLFNAKSDEAIDLPFFEIFEKYIIPPSNNWFWFSQTKSLD